MSNTDHSKPTGKTGQRSRKPKPQNKKPDQRQRVRPDQQPDRRQDEQQLIEAEVAPAETFPIEVEASTITSPIGAAVVPAEIPSKGALVPIDVSPIATVSIDSFFVGFQAIANAYRDYTRRSLEQTISFVETLTAVRSLDKAIEVQSEFAKQASGTFLADSQKIWRLYSELAKQVLRPFERLVTQTTQPAR